MHIRFYYALWALIVIVYFCNLNLDVLEVDAAQYASMSAEMLENGNYLHVYHRGNDYLDKPPLLFWLSAMSFNIFGVSNFAYKLPALLVLLLGMWSTYRFTLMYDQKETALMATTILASTQAMFLMTNDVRTDGLLTGFVMFAVYQCARYLNDPKWGALVMAGIGVGFAMLAKGPIGAIIPAIAIGSDLLIKRNWKALFQPGWLVVVAVALVVLAPMCYGLYTQFDLHPEKTVYGLQGPSGLEFFFWTQSFGRITGDIYWDNNAPFYYFLLTFLWDFMPWVIVFFGALAFTFRQIWRSRNLQSTQHNATLSVHGTNTTYPEFITIGGFVLVTILLSFSKYKLPHYIFPLFPFAAVITARYLVSLGKKGRGLSIGQFALMHVFFGAIIFTFLKAFPPQNILLPIVVILGYIATWIAFIKSKQTAYRILTTSTITAITFNLFMALHLYPNLLQFQSGAAAGKMIAEDQKAKTRPYYTYPNPSYSLDFYSGKYAPTLDSASIGNVPSGAWIFTSEEGYRQMVSDPTQSFEVVKEFDHYHISMLKMKFFLEESRAGQLKKFYLVEKR